MSAAGAHARQTKPARRRVGHDGDASATDSAVRLLDELGYETYVFARGALTPLSDAPLSQDVMNYIFLPRNAAATESRK